MVSRDVINNVVDNVIKNTKSYSHKPHLASLPYDLNTNDIDKLKERVDAIKSEIKKSKETLKEISDKRRDAESLRDEEEEFSLRVIKGFWKMEKYENFPKGDDRKIFDEFLKDAGPVIRKIEDYFKLDYYGRAKKEEIDVKPFDDAYRELKKHLTPGYIDGGGTNQYEVDNFILAYDDRRMLVAYQRSYDANIDYVKYDKEYDKEYNKLVDFELAKKQAEKKINKLK